MLIGSFSATATGMTVMAKPEPTAQSGGAVKSKFETFLKTPTAGTSARFVEHTSRQNDTKKDTFAQFEAVFLRNFVEAILPPEDAGSFGTGSAGEYWRSILADEMSQAIAESGQLGIADILRKNLQKQKIME